jgi:hypothetical protein
MVDIGGSLIPARDLPDDAKLGREAAAEALSEIGYRTAPATLATKASRGLGPPYVRYGNRVLYRWGDLKAWAEASSTPGIPSASEVTTMLMRRLIEG